MDELTMYKAILDSYPYPIVFIDGSYTIRFLNKNAKYHYYSERGYADLIGKSLFDCHDTDIAKEKISAAFEKMKSDGKEVYLGINTRNQRYYMQCVRNDANEVIGFIERFELNQQK